MTDAKKSHRGHNEGSIYLTKDGKWRGAAFLGVSPEGKPIRKYVSGATKAEVKGKVKAILAEHERGMPIAARDQTVKQFLERWLEDDVRQNERPRTYEAYESVVRVHLVPALGRHKLSTLTAQHIEAMLARRKEEGLSGSSLLNIRSIIRAALNQAMRWDLIGRNVATLTTPPKTEKFEAKPLSPDEVLKFLAAIRGNHLEAMYALTVWLGLRQGEVFGLRWEDIDLESHTLHIRRQLQWIGKSPRVPLLMDLKTEQSRRTLPIPAPVIEVLQRHRDRRQQDQALAGMRWKGSEWDLVFYSAIGTPLDPSNVIRQFRSLLKDAGIPSRRFHDLRHSCGSFLASRNVHPRVAMQILGHSQIATTMNTYTHVDLDSMRGAMDSITDIFAEVEGDKRSS